ncbi:hypothetical protein [Nocardia fusca]|uniref:hypothetical protein n=1 Tax=Nocardia fusca TaxID=941183 RepID=UPI000AB21FF1|nr:hypothetical protein [Nocardia fusca]
MTNWIARVRRSWAEFVGPEATRTNNILTLAAGAAGLLGPARVARRKGAGPSATALVSMLGVDLVGGAYVNNTKACARWYERPGQEAKHHLRFAALHIHPAVIAYLDSNVERQPNAVRWATAHYTYMMLSTWAIRNVPEHRRSLGVTLTAGGLLLDRALGPSEVAPWFAWTYYPKLLLGHAATALWRERDLDTE